MFNKTATVFSYEAKNHILYWNDDSEVFQTFPKHELSTDVPGVQYFFLFNNSDEFFLLC